MATNAIRHIKTTTLGSSTSNINFASIPSTYKSLLFKLSIRTDRSATTDTLVITVNGLSTSIYLRPFLVANGTTKSGVSTRITSTTSWSIPNAINGASSTSNYYSYGEVLFPDYQIANAKSGIATFSANHNATGGSYLTQSGLGLNSTAAITSVEFGPGIGTNFLTNSSISLYGILNS